MRNKPGSLPVDGRGQVAFGESLAFSLFVIFKVRSCSGSCAGCVIVQDSSPEDLATLLSGSKLWCTNSHLPQHFSGKLEQQWWEFLLDTFCMEFVFGFILGSEFCEPSGYIIRTYGMARNEDIFGCWGIKKKRFHQLAEITIKF